MEIDYSQSFLPEGYIVKRKKGGRPKKKDFQLYPDSVKDDKPTGCVTCGDPTYSCDCICKGSDFIPF